MLVKLPEQDLLGPVVKLATGITAFIAGSGAKLFGFLGRFGIVKAAGGALGAAGGAVAGVARLAGKILLPLGILFSAFDAFEAWQKTDGTFDWCATRPIEKGYSLFIQKRSWS